MSQQNEGIKAFTATSAVEAYRRVKLTAGSGTAVEYAGLGEAFIGITQSKAAAGEMVAVALRSASRTFKVTAAKVIAVATTLYGAANGKVSDASSGTALGTTLEAAGADGDVIEVTCDNGAASSINGATPATVADGGHAIPFVIQKSFPDAATGDVEIYNANAPFKFRVIDAWVENRAANGANANTVQVCAAAAGASTITDAMSLNGKVDTDVVRAANIDDGDGTIAAGGSLYLRVTKAGGTVGGNVYISCLRVA